MRPSPQLPLVLALAGCPSDPDDPGVKDTPSSDTPSDTATTPTGATGDSTHTGSALIEVTGHATVSTREDLAPWLGFDVVLEGVTEATLGCDSDTDPTERHARTVGPGATSLTGLLADHAYTCWLAADLGGQAVELWREGATTPPLPEGLPELAVLRNGGEVEGAWLVLNQWDQGPTQRALVIDGEGRIRWHRALDSTTAGTNVEWAGDSFVAAGGRTLPPSQFDIDGNELFRGPDLDELLDWHHEARMVDVDGTRGVLGLRSTELPKGIRTWDGFQKGFAAEVFDPATGELLWSFDVIDHLDQWGPIPVDWDPWHVNAVTWEEDGHSWFSARSTNQLRRVNRATGEVTHTLGAFGDMQLLDAAGTPLPISSWFAGQHGPTQVGDRLFLVDNGRASRGYSRAVEYRLDLDAHTVTEVWSWTEDGWFEPYYGNVSLTPGGNVLVASGHCNYCDDSGGRYRKAFVAEIDPATNDILWRMDMVNHRSSLFRAQFVPACDLFHHVGLCPPD